MRKLCPLLMVALLTPLASAAGPFEHFTRGWIDDPAWGVAGQECAVYEAIRPIADRPARYDARVCTHKAAASPDTFTLNPTGEGRAVLSQNLREDIPLDDREALHRVVTCFVGTDDLKSLKLESGSVDASGVTFKRIINHAGTLRSEQFSPLPREGRAAESYTPPDNLVFFNALPTVLRGYPFDNPAEFELAVIDDQLDARWTNVRPGKFVVRYGGRHTLDLPIGEVEAHQLMLFFVGPSREFRAPAKFWFAADPAWRHVMVQYEGPGGTTWRLKHLNRPQEPARPD